MLHHSHQQVDGNESDLIGQSVIRQVQDLRTEGHKEKACVLVSHKL